MFQNGNQGNVFKIDTKEIFLKWTQMKYFQYGHQGNIFEKDSKKIF